jgi:nitrate reductase delta subunit
VSRPTRTDARARAAAQQACALLLGYPDQRLLDQMPLLAAVVARLPDDTEAALRGFLDYLEHTPTEQLRTHYVETFDLRRKCCLFLTYWTHGDTRNRGLAMLRFKEVYRASGAAPPEHELPDHLSVVLEFAAVADPVAGNQLLAAHRAPIELVRAALREAGSAYALVLDAVVATLAPMTAQLAQQVRELAATGPPSELVGLGAEPLPLVLTHRSATSTEDG